MFYRAGNPPEVGGIGAWTSWAKQWSNQNGGAGSGLDADLLDGRHAASMLPLQSQRDFVNGTLIQTSIDYSVSGGDAWLLEIAEPYTHLIPFDIYIQGYIYDNTIISHGGLSNGTTLVGLVAINWGQALFLVPPSGVLGWLRWLCVSLAASGTDLQCRCTSITDSAKPGAQLRKSQPDFEPSAIPALECQLLRGRTNQRHGRACCWQFDMG